MEKLAPTFSSAEPRSRLSYLTPLQHILPLARLGLARLASFALGLASARLTSPALAAHLASPRPRLLLPRHRLASHGRPTPARASGASPRFGGIWQKPRAPRRGLKLRAAAEAAAPTAAAAVAATTTTTALARGLRRDAKRARGGELPVPICGAWLEVPLVRAPARKLSMRQRS